MTTEWDRDESAQAITQAERVVVLFYGAWCPFSRIFLPDFEAAEAEAPVPLARVALKAAGDDRWGRYGVEVTPTLVYFEHGEPLERLEGVKGRGISRRDLEAFLDLVGDLQEEPRLPRRMHGPRRA